MRGFLPIPVQTCNYFFSPSALRDKFLPSLDKKIRKKYFSVRNWSVYVESEFSCQWRVGDARGNLNLFSQHNHKITKQKLLKREFVSLFNVCDGSMSIFLRLGLTM